MVGEGEGLRTEMGLARLRIEMGLGIETADAMWEGHTPLKTGVLTDNQTHRQYICQFHSVHLADIGVYN